MEDDRKLSRFYNGFYFQGDRSTTYAERAADCKLARLRRRPSSLFLAAGMALVGLSFLFLGVETHGRAMTVEAEPEPIAVAGAEVLTQRTR